MSYEIVEKLKKEIAGFKDDERFESVGVVIEAGDGIIKISGLRGSVSQELLHVETSEGEVAALAFNLEEHTIGAVLLGESRRVRVGDRVRGTGTVFSVRVGEELIGRVINPLGEPEDGKGTIFKNQEQAAKYPAERAAPSVVDRESVRTPLQTGIKAIDAMIPIGRGQRELIIGDRQTGKTAIAIDAILNQKRDTARPAVVAVYVAVGQKNSKVASIVKLLEERGALDYTIVVSAPSSAPAALQYLAPFVGTAIGEYFMDNGRDALVIYDDLSKHANAYRELSLLLRRPPGREAYPGDIFFLHSRLLERSAKLSKEKGGGSLTALPIIETQLNDVSAYVPTNVISITDGQIYLESGLFNKGIRPAVNVGLSVSRVGSSAQTKAMKKVAGKLRLELAQFRELAAFMQFASDLDETTKKKLARGELLTEILKQSDLDPAPVEEQVVTIYAAINGYLDEVPVSKVREFQASFLEYLRKLYEDSVLIAIATSGELSDAVEGELKKALGEFRAAF
jgi:F-type H+-transporting ATPase subunit alpha